jgi:uncharacterized protein (DUF2141 family)
MRTILQSPILSVKVILIALLPVIFTNKTYNQSSDYTTGTLIITFTDIRSDIGNIRLGLYDAPEQWTDNARYHYVWDKEELKDGRLTVEIKDLPRTTYAFSVLDDEDENETMTYKLGLPVEGWGMSNNPSFARLKAPAFDEVSFELDNPLIRFEINMVYLNKNKKVR